MNAFLKLAVYIFSVSPKQDGKRLEIERLRAEFLVILQNYRNENVNRP